MISYELINTTNHHIDAKTIENGLQLAESKVGPLENRFITIEIVPPEMSHQLNQQWRDKNEPTDCISLSTTDSDVGEQLITESSTGALEFTLKLKGNIEHTWPALGQLIICYDIVKANADRAGQPVERELEWVVAHGVWHILGFHHDQDH